jgi:hypothetical protein
LFIRGIEYLENKSYLYLVCALKKYLPSILFNVCLYLLCLTEAFSQGSFYIDSIVQSSSSRVAFSNDAVYFYNDAYLVKTDYSGAKIWSRDNIFSKLIEAGGSLFGIRNDSLIKMDTSANLVWIKKFTTPICPAVGLSNYFSEIVYDGSQLYLHEVQDPGQGNYSSIHTATLLVDTAGNILNTRCDSIFIGPWGGYGQGPGCASIVGGAIFSYGDISGNSLASYCQRENSNGSLDQNVMFPVFSFGNTDNIKTIIPTPDSNYIILSNAQYYQPVGGLASLFTLVKVSESGSIIWQYSGYDGVNVPTLSNYKYLNGIGVAIDDSNQVYLIGQAGITSIYDGYFGSKFDANGNILFTKFWHASNPVKFYWQGWINNTLHYKNDSIYCLSNAGVNGNNCKPAIVVFDKQVSNNCFPEDSSLSLIQYPPFLGFASLTRWSYNSPYTPVNDLLSSNNISVDAHDLCLSLNAKVINSFSEMKIFPNPGFGKFTFSMPDEKRNVTLSIFNSMGEIILIKNEIGDSEIEVDLSNQPAGIYIVKVIFGEKIFRRKIIKS